MAIPSAEDKTEVSVPATKSSEIATPVSIPSSKSSRAASVNRAPLGLTANPADPFEPPFALNHARILYENVMRDFDTFIDNTGTDTGARALMYDTGKRWAFTQAGGSNAIRADFNIPVTFDTLCIAGHNLADVGGTVKVRYDEPPAGGLITLETLTPQNNDPIMIHFDEQLLAVKIQLTIEGANGDVEIAYVSAGVALQMQRPFFNGHTPITDSDETQYYRAKTESGNIIGRSIRSQGFRTQYQWNNLNDAWYRQYFAPFKEAAKTVPFFIAWNLLEYPNDVGFGHTSGDISAPMQNGFVTRRSVSFELLGY